MIDVQQPPDGTEPTPERQEALERAYQANISADRAPYQDVSIKTLGELRWVLRKRQWRDSLDLSKPEANLAGVDMHRANLSGVVLRGANLMDANLVSCTLVGANFLEANLTGAFLRFADLSQAFLGNAKLSSASLLGANLSQARVWRADLRGAELDDVNVVGARLDEADVSGASLRNVRMDVATVLREIKFDDMTRVADVVWNNVPLIQVAWENIPELGDETWLHVPWSAAKAGESREKVIAETRAAMRANQQLAVALRVQGLNEYADHYAYRAQLIQREVFRLKKERGRFCFSWLLFLISGYGYRLWRILAAYGTVLLVFSVVYWLMGVHSFPHESSLQGLWDSFLVSLSAIHGRTTFEQLGAWSPTAWIAAVESVVGIVIEGVFVAMLVQRFFGK